MSPFTEQMTGDSWNPVTQFPWQGCPSSQGPIHFSFIPHRPLNPHPSPQACSSQALSLKRCKWALSP